MLLDRSLEPLNAGELRPFNRAVVGGERQVRHRTCESGHVAVGPVAADVGVWAELGARDDHVPERAIRVTSDVLGEVTCARAGGVRH
jgi:hypothetical protein